MRAQLSVSIFMLSVCEGETEIVQYFTMVHCVSLGDGFCNWICTVFVTLLLIITQNSFETLKMCLRHAILEMSETANKFNGCYYISTVPVTGFGSSAALEAWPEPGLVAKIRVVLKSREWNVVVRPGSTEEN